MAGTNTPKQDRILDILVAGSFLLWGIVVAIASFAYQADRHRYNEQLAAINKEISNGILPRADERIRQLEMENLRFRLEVDQLEEEINQHLREEH